MKIPSHRINASNLKPARFSMDATGAASFVGYTTGETWNGWECPCFPGEVARQIVRAVTDFQTARYDADADEFVFQAPGEEAERFGAFEVESVGKLYAVGAGAWIWKRV